MERTTKQQVASAFRNLCRASGRKMAKDTNDVGGWALDYIACYGGYTVVEITEHLGCPSNPFGLRRMKPSEAYEAFNFAARAIGLTKRADPAPVCSCPHPELMRNIDCPVH